MNDVDSGSIEGAMLLMRIEASESVALGGDQQPIRESRGPLLTTGEVIAALAALLEIKLFELVMGLF